MDRQQTWVRLEELLRAVLSAEKHRFRFQDVELISEFIENREYGLAFEVLGEAFERQHITPDGDTRAAMKSAAELMRIN